MRYLPLSDTDRGEMLRLIGGSGSIDELFRAVPKEARLRRGRSNGLPMHDMSEMAVERSHRPRCRARTWLRAKCPSSWAAARTSITSRPASTTSSSAASF